MELRRRPLLPLFLSMAVLNLVAGFGGSYLTAPYHPTRDNNNSDDNNININNSNADDPNGERFPFEPKNTPPSWLFATVWTFVYIGTAYAQAVLMTRVMKEAEEDSIARAVREVAAAAEEEENGAVDAENSPPLRTAQDATADDDKKKFTRPLALLDEYRIHAILLHSWTFLFFGFKLYALALVSMLVLLYVAVDIFMKIRRPNRKEGDEAAQRTALATLLWHIYIAWFVFAISLNVAALKNAYEARAYVGLFLPVADVCEGTRMGHLIGTVLKRVPSADLPPWVVTYCSVAGSYDTHCGVAEKEWWMSG